MRAAAPAPSRLARLLHRQHRPAPTPLDRGSLPAYVRVVEVGPRDGLQNERTALDAPTKAALVRMLLAAGLTRVEGGSMVSKAWVPQMADSADVLLALAPRPPGVRVSALTPNLKGFEAALAAGADEVAVFAAATDAFSLKNINCGVLDSLARFRPVMQAAAAAHIPVRGYVSCAVGCPYSGAVTPGAVGHVAAELLRMGCYEVSLGDTIGVGTPWSVRRMLLGVVAECGVDVARLAFHAHDTYGLGMANVAAAISQGVSVFDSSVAGLGGCPYAGGSASGNIATEDLLFLLHGLGVHTGVDADAVGRAADFITAKLGVSSRSRAGGARSARRRALEEAEASLLRLAQEPTVASTAAGAGEDAAASAALAAAAVTAREKARAKAEATAAQARMALETWPERPSLPWAVESAQADSLRDMYALHHALERESVAAPPLVAEVEAEAGLGVSTEQR